MERYDPRTIEPRWQQRWDVRARLRDAEPANPGADGTAHLVRARDVALPVGRAAHGARAQLHDRRRALPPATRVRGLAVLHPMGWDAFGLPAENAAIKGGRAPARVDRAATSPTIRRQLKRMGSSYDWSRELATARSRVLPLDAVDLPAAARARASPTAQGRRSTGARSTRPCSPTSRSIDGRCERCGAAVEKRELEQWFFRITAYADGCSTTSTHARAGPSGVHDDAAQLDRPLARARGSSSQLPVRRRPDATRSAVFTTRPDTIFGVTFCRARARAPAGRRS